MKANTSASPFRWTFAQVKALTLDSHLLLLPTTLSWAPFAFGFPPKPWLKVVNIMIEKNPNDFGTHRLQAIGLLDSLSQLQ